MSDASIGLLFGNVYLIFSVEGYEYPISIAIESSGNIAKKKATIIKELILNTYHTK